MAPSWLKFIVQWLAKRRLRTGAQQRQQQRVPRRRASFPVYEPIKSHGHQQYSSAGPQQMTQQQQQQRQSYPRPPPPPPHFSQPHPPPQSQSRHVDHPHYATIGRSGGPPMGPQIQPLTTPSHHNQPPPPVTTHHARQRSNSSNQRNIIPPPSSHVTVAKTGSGSPFTPAQIDSYRAMGLVPVAHMVPGSNQPQYYLVPAQTMSQVPAAQPVTIPGTTTATTQQQNHRHTSAPLRPRPKSASVSRPPPPPPPTPKSPFGPSKSPRLVSVPPPTPQAIPLPVTPGHPASPLPPPTAPMTHNTKQFRISRRNSVPVYSLPYNSSPKKVHDAAARYAGFWSPSRSPKPLTFRSVAWPMVEPPLLPTSITVHAVRAFLLSPHVSVGVPARERVEQAMAIWEPKAFWTRFGGAKAAGEAEMIERALAFLQGSLRILLQEVTAADALDSGLLLQ